MNIILIPPSDKELKEAINYYNDQMPGLGDQFYNTFLSSVNYISIAPETWRKVGRNTRSIPLVISFFFSAFASASAFVF